MTMFGYHHIHQFLIGRIMSGGMGIEGFDRPKYLSDQIWNKVTMQEIHPLGYWTRPDASGPFVAWHRMLPLESVGDRLVHTGKKYPYRDPVVIRNKFAEIRTNALANQIGTDTERDNLIRDTGNNARYNGLINDIFLSGELVGVIVNLLATIATDINTYNTNILAVDQAILNSHIGKVMVVMVNDINTAATTGNGTIIKSSEPAVFTWPVNTIGPITVKNTDPTNAYTGITQAKINNDGTISPAIMPNGTGVQQAAANIISILAAISQHMLNVMIDELIRTHPFYIDLYDNTASSFYPDSGFDSHRKDTVDDNSLSYYKKGEVWAARGAKTELVRVRVKSKTPLQMLGVQRYDTKLVRNIVFITQLHRVVRWYMRQALHNRGHPLVYNEDVAEEENTEYFNNEVYDKYEYTGPPVQDYSTTNTRLN